MLFHYSFYIMLGRNKQKRRIEVETQTDTFKQFDLVQCRLGEHFSALHHLQSHKALPSAGKKFFFKIDYNNDHHGSLHFLAKLLIPLWDFSTFVILQPVFVFFF